MDARQKKGDLSDRCVVSSAQVDDARTAIGGSAFVGDLANTGIPIPEAATGNQRSRYLFMICGVSVPNRAVCVIRYLRQLLYIGADVPTEAEQEDEQWRVEIPVTDPLWSFPDGNVSWHLRSSDVRSPDRRTFDDVPFAAASPIYGNRGDVTSPALLARNIPPSYVPLNGGTPYGQSIAGLGTFRDMRYPWLARDHFLGLQVEGPCKIQFFASVYQTDPDNRPDKPVIIEPAGLRKEDLFMFNYPTSRYTRIGGSMEVDLIAVEEAGKYPVSS